MNKWIAAAALLVLAEFSWAVDPSVPSDADIAPAAAPLPMAVKTDDAHLDYVGRFDRHDPAGPRFAWSASSVTVRFNGTDLQAAFVDTGKNYFEVIVDGKPAANPLRPGKGHDPVDVARGLPAGEHTVTLFRRTEASGGATQLTGLRLNDGATLLDPQRPPHRVEVIGDSISCAFGNEAHDKADPFLFSTENAWLSYGAIAARALNAEYRCEAWSGKKMAPNNTIPSIYDRTIPSEEKSTWDPAEWKPEVILINLSTNDFNAKERPEEAGWTAAYEAFVHHLREINPTAELYLAGGPLLTGEKLTAAQKYLDHVLADLLKGGDTHVHRIEFPVQDIKADGVGAKWHPSVKTHEKMAALFVQTVQKDLGWEAAK